MANAYEAGAAGLPCAVFRGYIGVDLPKVNPNIKSIVCPYTGETLATVPAIRPDVAVIHALRADRAGNVLLEGIVGVQKQAVLAARRSIVTVEEIVDDFGPRNLNAVILPAWTVTAVVCVPGGAHPSYAQGYYKRDNAYYKKWDAISRDRDRFLAWMKTTCSTRARTPSRPSAGGSPRLGDSIMPDTHTRHRDDDHRGRARAQEQRCLLRRHWHAVGGLQSRPPDPRAGHHLDL